MSATKTDSATFQEKLAQLKTKENDYDPVELSELVEQEGSGVVNYRAEIEIEVLGPNTSLVIWIEGGKTYQSIFRSRQDVVSVKMRGVFKAVGSIEEIYESKNGYFINRVRADRFQTAFHSRNTIGFFESGKLFSVDINATSVSGEWV